VKYLNLNVHGLIFETSVWLLAESTRLLPKLIYIYPNESLRRSFIILPMRDFVKANVFNGLVSLVIRFTKVWISFLAIPKPIRTNLRRCSVKVVMMSWVLIDNYTPLSSISNRSHNHHLRRPEWSSFRPCSHSSIASWTSQHVFTTTQSETVNQLPHTSVPNDTLRYQHFDTFDFAISPPALIVVLNQFRCVLWDSMTICCPFLTVILSQTKHIIVFCI
jgi:hypothetical protein